MKERFPSLPQSALRCLASESAMNSSGKSRPVRFASALKRCCISRKLRGIFTYKPKLQKGQESYGKEKQVNTPANIRISRPRGVACSVGGKPYPLAKESSQSAQRRRWHLALQPSTGAGHPS